MSDLLHLPIDQVKPDPDQPRKQFDKDALNQLRDSIKQHGVVTPITVRKNGKGYIIVAGERRWRASQAAKLQTIPAKVVESDAPLTLATIENVVREDLTPIEEGDAYLRLLDDGDNEKAIAKLVSRPLERVKERIAWARLGPIARAKIDSGEIGPAGAKLLTYVASVSADVAEALAYGVGVAYNGKFLAENASRAITELGSPPSSECGTCYGHGNVWPDDEDNDTPHGPTQCTDCKGSGKNPNPVKRNWPDFFVADISPYGSLNERTIQTIVEGVAHNPELVESLENAYETWANTVKTVRPGVDLQYQKPSWPESAIDAARAYGCLLEFGKHASFLTDPDFAADLLLRGIVETTKRLEDEHKRTKGKAPEPSDPDAEKAARKAARDQQAEERRAARSRNLALGTAIAKKLAEPKVTTEAMKLLVGEILTHTLGVRESYYGEPEDRTFGAGLGHFRRFTEEQKLKKNGEAIYPRGQIAGKQAVEAIERELARARNPQQVLGVLYRVLAHAAFVDVRGLVQADKDGCNAHDFKSQKKATEILRKLLPASTTDGVPENGWWGSEHDFNYLAEDDDEDGED